MPTVRSAEELGGVDDPAWPTIQDLVQHAVVSVEILPIDNRQGSDVLHRLQVTARSPLGALALNCGGMLVDHGWLRLLGAGSGGLPSLAEANGLGEPTADSAPPAMLVVGFDVLGGRFAVNGGGLPGGPGEVCYFGPDTLNWQPIGGGHGQLLSWALQGGLASFYENLRWPGWESEVGGLAPGEGISVYPFLFTEQGRDPGAAQRRPVPFAELLLLLNDLAEQVRNLPDGAAFNIRVD